MRLGGHAPAAELGPLVLGRTGHAPPALGRGELQHDPRRVFGLAVVAAQPPLAAVVAGYAAEERVTDAVEDAGFAGSRTAGDQEDAVVGARSEERRVGKECVSTCRYRGSPDH